MAIIHIIAGSWEQARHIARKCHLDDRDWSYVDSYYRLQGIRKGMAWLYGTYRDRFDWEHVQFMLRHAEFTVLAFDEHDSAHSWP